MTERRQRDDRGRTLTPTPAPRSQALAGFYGNAGAAATLCPANSYCPAGSTAARPCPQNKGSPEGSDDVSQCTVHARTHAQTRTNTPSLESERRAHTRTFWSNDVSQRNILNVSVRLCLSTRGC
jgi:hypothetical protein